MNDSTAAALNRINRRFYSRHSGPFSATRSRPWPGWERALVPFMDRWPPTPDGETVPSILDVGCGNGRFLKYLSSAYAGRLHYLGVDDSEELLAQARRLLVDLPLTALAVRNWDLVSTSVGRELMGQQFHMIVAFGILHHLPGLERRRLMLTRLVDHLLPGGFLVLSFWQFGRHSRFQRRALDWADHNRASGDSIDASQLERGDFLLAWGDGLAEGFSAEDELGPRRYCHYADPAEASDLVSTLDLSLVDRFEADGRSGDLNLYFVLQNPD